MILFCSSGICVSCQTKSCGRAPPETWPTSCGAQWRSRWTARCASTRRAWTWPSNTSCPPRSPCAWPASAKSLWVRAQTSLRRPRGSEQRLQAFADLSSVDLDSVCCVLGSILLLLMLSLSFVCPQNQLHTFNDVCNNESLVSDTETWVPSENTQPHNSTTFH